MSGVRYDEETKKKIYELYVVEKVPAAVISRMDGMPTEKTIRQILIRQGVELRGNQQRFDRAEILRQIKQNPVRVVAAKHGCSQRIIYKYAGKKKPSAKKQTSKP